MGRPISHAATFQYPSAELTGETATPSRSAPALDSVLESVRPLAEMGVAFHWLPPFKKRPIGEKWSEAPRLTLDGLRAAYTANANIGVRLGEVSTTAAGYLHLIDTDIRDAAQADHAWSVLLKIFPEARKFPSVISGSGGESRHIYFFSLKPFNSRNLARSEGYSTVFDPEKGREVKKRQWEIDLYGTDKQAVVPPSIHPDTGLPYRWERPFDLTLLGFGIGPSVGPELVESWGASTSESSEDDEDDDLFAFVKSQPMGLSEQEISDTVANLPQDWVEDRDTWVQVGAALNHEYQGSQKGFDRWCEWSKQSAKFDMKDQKVVWKSFKGARNPVRMATLIQAAGRNKLAQDHDWIGDLTGPSAGQTLPAVVEGDDLAALLGETSPAEVISEVRKVSTDWHSLLQLTEDGQVKSTLPNVSLIFANDPRTVGIVAYNEFTQDVVLRGTVGRFALRTPSPKPVKQLDTQIWNVRDPINGDLWTDMHEIVLRGLIETPRRQGGYDLKISDRDLNGAVRTVAEKNRVHPVREYLLAQAWDGAERMDTMFVDYLGCPDTPYHRAASRMTLLGAVARVFEPGQKFDFVPILEGLQGKGKSTFINILGRSWASELVGDFGDAKQMVESMQGKWILEIPELQGFSKADILDIKAFVSRTSDKVRLAYAKNAMDYPRQCIFIGSTNESEYLRDQTGGRRFWPIKCEIEGQIDNKRFSQEINQIWAEAYATYRKLRETYPTGTLPLYLSNEAVAEEAQAIQESRRSETPEDVLAADIIRWQETPIGTEIGHDDLDADAPRLYRNETITREIFNEVMGRDGQPMQREVILIGRAFALVPGWERTPGVVFTEKFGKTRAYRRKSAFTHLDYGTRP